MRTPGGGFQTLTSGQSGETEVVFGKPGVILYDNLQPEVFLVQPTGFPAEFTNIQIVVVIRAIIPHSIPFGLRSFHI